MLCASILALAHCQRVRKPALSTQRSNSPSTSASLHAAFKPGRAAQESFKVASDTRSRDPEERASSGRYVPNARRRDDVFVTLRLALGASCGRVWRDWRRCNVLLSECILAEHTALKRRSQRVEDSSQRKLLLIALNRPTIQTPPKQLTPLTAFGATTFYVCAQGGLSSVCARCERLESREHDANESPWLTVASVDSVLSARARQTRAMAPGGLERKVGWCSRVAQV